MKAVLSTIVTLCVFCFIQSAAAEAPTLLPVFPGAVGFGSFTPAGSGRHLVPPKTRVVRVTSLADSGAGTLRDCVKLAEPRICVFEISGTIQLNSELLIDKPYLTIAGQTAPAPGILLAGAGVRVATNDVLIQHLQIRVGDAISGPDPENRDGITVAGKSSSIAMNVVLDHLSLSWAVDENLGIWYESTADVTLSHSIIAEGLHKSIHPKGPHSMGVLIGDGVKRVTLHHNLLAHNNDRNPRLKPGALVEFTNNVVYDWGGSSSWNQANISDTDKTGIPSFLAMLGNYYKPGPRSPKGGTIYGKPPAKTSRVYVLSNFGPKRTKDSQSEWSLSTLSEKPYRTLTPPFPLNDILPNHPVDTLTKVLSSAGSRPRESNSVDTRIISEVTLGTGSLRDCVSGCTRSAGGYPQLEVRTRSIVLPANPQGDDDGDGYTNLEEYLHSEAIAVE